MDESDESVKQAATDLELKLRSLSSSMSGISDLRNSPQTVIALQSLKGLLDEIIEIVG